MPDEKSTLDEYPAGSGAWMRELRSKLDAIEGAEELTVRDLAEAVESEVEADTLIEIVRRAKKAGG